MDGLSYAATEEGLYSFDGVHWKQVAELGTNNVSALHFMGGYSYVATSQGLFYLTAPGRHWAPVDAGL